MTQYAKHTWHLQGQGKAPAEAASLYQGPGAVICKVTGAPKVISTSVSFCVRQTSGCTCSLQHSHEACVGGKDISKEGRKEGSKEEGASKVCLGPHVFEKLKLRREGDSKPSLHGVCHISSVLRLPPLSSFCLLCLCPRAAFRKKAQNR